MVREDCWEFVNHKPVKENSPIFNPKNHCPVMQKGLFEAKKISSHGDEFDCAFDLDNSNGYLKNDTRTAVQKERTELLLDDFNVGMLRLRFEYEYYGTKETMAGVCTNYLLDLRPFFMQSMCFSNGVIYQYCDINQDYCLDFIDHKDISADDKRFDPDELDCDHFDPVEP
ncbi:hypothetical protein GEMRC1_013240 [Eukaryota sp. GEM-RC1]